MGESSHVWSDRVDPVPGAGRHCRHAVTDLLHRAQAEHLAADAALLVSELVANVVLHARTSAEVRMSVRDGVLLVEVSDGSPGSVAPQHTSPYATTGRGLALVEAIADAWGSRPVSGGGKVVWFELGGPPVDPAS